MRRCFKDLLKMFGSDEVLLYPSVPGDLCRNGVMGFIIYEIRSADKRSKALKASNPELAHGHLQPTLLGAHMRWNVSLDANLSMLLDGNMKHHYTLDALLPLWRG